MVNKSHFIAQIRQISHPKTIYFFLIDSETLIQSELPKNCQFLQKEPINSQQLFYVRGRLQCKEVNHTQSFITEQIIPI
ncbi:MAG: hypothetical protein ACRCWD_00740 [Culicoidibacterales bacterium]